MKSEKKNKKGGDKMSTTDKGVLIFNEWFEASRELSSIEFKKLFMAMYNYQAYGTEPPQFKSKTKPVASIVFPCLKRRMDGARFARFGADPVWEPARVESPTPEAKEKKKKEKYSTEKKSTYARESEGDSWDEFFELAARKALGEQK